MNSLEWNTVRASSPVRHSKNQCLASSTVLHFFCFLEISIAMHENDFPNRTFWRFLQISEDLKIGYILSTSNSVINCLFMQPPCDQLFIALRFKSYKVQRRSSNLGPNRLFLTYTISQTRLHWLYEAVKLLFDWKLNLVSAPEKLLSWCCWCGNCHYSHVGVGNCFRKYSNPHFFKAEKPKFCTCAFEKFEEFKSFVAISFESVSGKEEYRYNFPSLWSRTGIYEFCPQSKYRKKIFLIFYWRFSCWG